MKSCCLSKEVCAILYDLQTPRSKEIIWLNQFYQIKIAPKVNNTIEKEIFKEKPITLKSLGLLKEVFTHRYNLQENTAKKTLPLIELLEDPHDICWDLQNRLFKEIINPKSPVAIHTLLPQNSFQKLKQLISLQFLMFCKNKLNKIKKNKSNEKEWQAIKGWIDKEILIYKVIKRPYQRTKKGDLREKLSTHRDECQSYFDIIYLLNGAWRLPTAIQKEAMILKRILINYQARMNDLVEPFESDNGIFARLLLLNLFLAIDLMTLLLIPYRLLRSIVNEVCLRIFHGLRNTLAWVSPKLKQDVSALGFSYVMSFFAFICLLMTCQLPLLPIPFFWLPGNFLSTILPISLGGNFLATLIFSSVYHLRQSLYGVKVPKKTKRSLTKDNVVQSSKPIISFSYSKKQKEKLFPSGKDDDEVSPSKPLRLKGHSP